MVKVGCFISNDAPCITGAAMWIKPTADGFLLYVLDGGRWKPLIPVDDGGTVTPADDESLADALIGSSEDTATAATINGAKAYATGAAADAAAGAVNTITGTASDTSEDLTLYGLKAYIDSKTNSGGGGGSDAAL